MNPILELLYPSNACCLGCSDNTGTDKPWLCDACEKLLTRMDIMLSRENQSWPKDAVSMVRSVYRYRRPIDGIIQAFKYSGVYALADWISDFMADSLRDWDGIIADCLVPVPMHISRQRKRGYNQTEVLAKSLSEKTGIPCLNALKRVKNTPQQALSSDYQRRKNMKGAFALATDIAGMSIILIDDVITSGATANACAAVLRSGGASEVNLMTIASGYNERRTK